MQRLLWTTLVMAACDGGVLALGDDGARGDTDVERPGRDDSDPAGGDTDAHVGHTDDPPVPEEPYCASGCTWSADTVAVYGGGGVLSTAFHDADAVMDRQGRVRIGTADAFHREVLLHTETPTGFTSAWVARIKKAQQSLYAVSPEVSLAVDPQGGIHAAFADTHWRLAEPAGAGWKLTAHGALSQLELSPHNLVSVDADGTTHLFTEKVYRFGAPSAWTQGPATPGHVTDFGLDAGGVPVLIVDRQGAPSFRVQAGNRWDARPFGGTDVAVASLAMTPEGEPRVLVSRAGTTNLQVLSWTGSAWAADRVTGNAAPGSKALDLAVDRAGVRHVAFQDDAGAVVYAWSDGGDWHEETVATLEVDRLWMLVRPDGEPVIVAVQLDVPQKRRDTVLALRVASR